MNKPFSVTKVLSALFFLFTLSAPLSAHADLNAAFERLTGASGGGFTTSNEQSFRTKTREGATLGGATVRFSHKRYSLVRVSPPRYSAGCHGIDLHFGGISFINAEQITQMLNQILNGTLAVAFDMAITALCSPCSAAMKFAQKVANWANSLSVDTCQASQALVKAALNPKGIGQQMACSTVGMQAGKYSDWVESKQEACNDDSLDSLREDLADGGTDGDKEENAALVGNSTWIALQAIGMAPKTASDENNELKPYAELLISWLGTSISGSESNDGTMPPLINDADTIMSVFICGTNQPNGGTNNLLVSANAFCDTRVGSGSDGLQIYQCPDDDCYEMETVNLDDSDLGTGFLYIVLNELQGAINNVATNQPLTDTQKALISQAPFPLYRAINVAAISPELAESIVLPHAQSLSYMIALEYLKDIFRQGSQSALSHKLKPAVMASILDAMSDLKVQSIKTVEQLSVFSATSTTIMNSVRQINKAALSSSLALGITDTSFARAVGGH